VATTGKNRGRRARLRLRTLVRWLNYYEDTAVSLDETLLRAIPNTPQHFNEEMGNWKIAPYAFEPRKVDVDGISFFREDFSTPKLVAEANRHPSRARVGRVSAEQLRELLLTIVAAPDNSQPAGHAIIPEMRYVVKALRSTQERDQMRDLFQKLAQFASKNPIYSPPGLADPSR
jgi:hypothetical protein